MTNLTRWDPFADLRMTFDRLYDDGIMRPWRMLGSEGEGSTGSMPIEVSDSEDSIEVKAQLPGVKPEDISITVTDDVLNIKAEHREAQEEKQKNFVRHEIRYGAMQRNISLPAPVNAENAEATFDNGILNLRLMKTAEMKTRRIPITGSSGSQQIGQSQSPGQQGTSSQPESRAA
jgi:HSP20 family protein